MDTSKKVTLNRITSEILGIIDFLHEDARKWGIIGPDDESFVADAQKFLTELNVRILRARMEKDD